MSDTSSGTGFSWFGTGNQDGQATGLDDDLEGVQPPSQKVVDLFHGRASTTEPTDVHHRIGFGPGDAAAGGHTHDGVNSYALFDAAAVPQPVPTSPTNAQLATALNQAIALLQAKSS